jgi:hypothetical protein
MLKRPQFALDGPFPMSWDSHAPWDRRSAIVFDVWGLSEASDAALDCGNTHEGGPLEFQRTLIKDRILLVRSSADTVHRACVELYLSDLEETGRLTLVDAEHSIVQSTLDAYEPEDRPLVQAIFERLGFVKGKPAPVRRSPASSAASHDPWDH